MFRFLPSLLAVATVSSALVAQVPGTFTNFGSGCSGKVTTCISLNTTNTGIQGTLPNEYCYPAVAAGATTVLGFDVILMAATAPYQTSGSLYLEDPAVPGQPDATAIATGPMLLDTTEKFYRCVLASPVQIPAGATFWIAADTPNQHPSNFLSGSGTVPGTIYWRRTGTNWSPTGIVKNPAYKILCANPNGGGTAVGIPSISAGTMPVINTQFDINLSGSAPMSPAYLFFGVSNTQWGPFPLPFDMAAVGATGCQMFVSIDVDSGPVLANATGDASFSAVLPPNAGMVGNVIYLQWLAIDPGANLGSLIVSDAAEAKIGG